MVGGPPRARDLGVDVGGGHGQARLRARRSEDLAAGADPLCLAEEPKNTWVVTDATEPAKAAAGFSKVEDVKAADAKPLGALRFRLIGLVEMSPAEHKGHKVAVKGMLIKDPSGDRLNVTSLTTVTAACTK